MQDKWKCQRCGADVSEEERNVSNKISCFNDGVCLSCFKLLKKPGENEIKMPKETSDGWRIFNNIADYQDIFDQVSVCYNCLKMPDSFPVAAYLNFGQVADSYGAWFTYMSLNRAQELCQCEIN